jgi:DHA2 family multidrug resistance protein
LIVGLAAVAAVALVAGIIWELYQKHPIVNLRLFKNRSFAASAAMMLALGIVLYGTTVLLPEFVQVLMGYTAEQAGMMLSPGGLVIIGLLPFVGFLLSRVDARWLIAFGFASIAVALYHMTGINLEMSWGHAMMMRVYQSIGLAFLFVPINTVSYAGVEPGQNNQVSGLINLMRNVGGSVGISLTGVIVTERAQFHQQRLVQNATAYDPQMRSAVQGLAQSLNHAGLSMADATHQAYGRIYMALQAQALTMGYIDAFWILAILALLLLPLVFLLKRIEPGKAPAGAH